MFQHRSFICETKEGVMTINMNSNSEDGEMPRDEILKMLEERATVPLWPQAGRALGLSRGQTYRVAKKGKIETLGLGREMRVRTSWLRQTLGLDGAGAAKA
jgi:hypothetical protein